MHGVRSWDFEAVIGVGGQSEEAIESGIAFKLTWIGVGPHKKTVKGMEHPVVTFDHFLYFGEKGEDLRGLAPHLADRMYVKKARNVMNFNANEQAEIDKLLARVSDKPQSSALIAEPELQKICKPRRSTKY